MKILVLGEPLLRLSYNQPLNNGMDLKLNFGGAETNVGTNLANWGMDVSIYTWLPDNSITESFKRFLKSFGLNTSEIILSDGRFGSYFLEEGNMQKGNKVVYDRKYSSFTNLSISNDEIERLTDKFDILFLSGIALSVSSNAFENILPLIKKFKLKGKKIYFDCNFREKLINHKDYKNILIKVLPEIDYLFAGVKDAKLTLKLFDDNYISSNMKEEIEESFKRISHSHPNISKIFCTNRVLENDGSQKITGFLFEKNEMIISDTYYINEIVDRIGTGDAFAAGVLFSNENNYENKKIIEFSTKCNVLKHYYQGDSNYIALSEIELLNNQISDVKR